MTKRKIARAIEIMMGTRESNNSVEEKTGLNETDKDWLQLLCQTARGWHDNENDMEECKDDNRLKVPAELDPLE